MSSRLERGIKAAFGRPVQNAATHQTLTHTGLAAFNGGPATADNARKLSAVDRCIEVLSDSMSKLPVYVVDRETRERVDHPLNRLLGERPNPWQNASVAKKMIETSRICYGNGYALIRRDPGSLAPTEIIPLPHHLVTPLRYQTGEVIYRVISPYTGEMEMVDSMDMIHVMGYTKNGFSGIGVLARASEVIAAGRTRQQYDLSYYQNGGTPGGILQCEGDLTGMVEVPTEDGGTRKVKIRDVIRDEWQSNYGGPGNAGKTAVLDFGVKYSPLAPTNRDAQFIEASELSTKDIARHFGVQLYKLMDGDQSSYAANSQGAVEYVVSELHPKVTQYEEEYTYKLLSSEDAKRYYVHINMMAELRGDFASRGDWYKTMSEIGAFSVNDVLALEDMPDVPGGDERRASLNYVPLKDWEELSRKRNEVNGK